MIYISPRGDRATSSVSLAAAGVPVFSTATGDTVFTLGPGFRSAAAAGFSGDGERIFFLGGWINGPPVDSLVALRASTGEQLAGTKLPTSNGFNLAADPVLPLVYVETLEEGRPVVLVYSQDLVLQGRMTAPATVPVSCGCTCPEGTVSIDRSRNLLHVVWPLGQTGNTVTPGAFIWTFDLLPAP